MNLSWRTRFAPSPTGYLHLGHVVNALWVWDTAAAAGGEVLLRVEDHDRQRSRPEYEGALLDDLDWLGFSPHIHPTNEFRMGECLGRQSDRDRVLHIYEQALAPLRERGLVYGCDCTRSELRATEDVDGAYSGRCRERGLPLGNGLAWRVRLEATEEIFTDMCLGPQQQRSAGPTADLVVRDRLGNWTYHWCVVVDDLQQGITHVVRGEDLLPATGTQLALARLLGRAVPPVYLHHPLVMHSDTRKLSKSDSDTGIRDLRARHFNAPQVRALALRACALKRSPTLL